MEHTAAYRSNSRCWNNLDTGSKLMNLDTSNPLPKPASIHSVYKTQDEESADVLRSCDSFVPSPSSNYTTNWCDSSLLCSPWSTYSDEINPGLTAQLNTKIQSDNKEYGSEADLYGLVSNILEEQDKVQSCFTDGICSPMLKSLWPISLNRLCDQQSLLPDIKQSKDVPILQQDFRGAEFALSSETQKTESLFHEPPGVVQDNRWPRSRQTDNPSHYKINPRIGLNECSLPKHCLSPASLLYDTSKEPFQREPLVSPLNKYSLYTQLDSYDLLNNNKSNLCKNSALGFQDGRGLANVCSELTALDAELYARPIQAKQSAHKPNDFLADPGYAFAKSTNLLSDRLFMPEYEQKSDYGRKTPGGGRTALPNHLQKLSQRSDIPSALVMKSNGILSTANPNWPLWMNNQPHNNSTNDRHNQMNLNSLLSAPQKSPMLGFNCSSTCSLLEPDGHSQSHPGENLAFPYLEYSYGADQTNDRFGTTKDNCLHEARGVSGKRLEAFNGLHENLLSRSNSHENPGKGIYEDKRMQCNAEHLYAECLAQAYQGMLCNMANCNNQKLGSSHNKQASSSNATHSLNACSVSAPMVGNITNNLASLCATNFHLPLMDNYAYKELNQTYPQISERLHGDTSLHNIASMISSQKSAKLRSRSAAQLHLHLEECYQQFRSLEQDRKKTECVFMETFPGKMVSSVNNICIQKLPSNPSRVDRLIVDQLHEQARVITLVGKMERYCSTPFHPNISNALDRYLETIHYVQARRREEIVNTSGRQKHKRAHQQDDRDVCALASSIKEMTLATRKVRTSLWCALQMALSSCPRKAHDKG